MGIRYYIQATKYNNNIDNNYATEYDNNYATEYDYSYEDLLWVTVVRKSNTYWIKPLKKKQKKQQQKNRN